MCNSCPRVTQFIYSQRIVLSPADYSRVASHSSTYPYLCPPWPHPLPTSHLPSSPKLSPTCDRPCPTTFLPSYTATFIVCAYPDPCLSSPSFILLYLSALQRHLELYRFPFSLHRHPPVTNLPDQIHNAILSLSISFQF